MCLTPQTTIHGNNHKNFDFTRHNVKNHLHDLELTTLDSCTYIDYQEFEALEYTPSSLSVLQLNIRRLINKQSELNKILT